MEHVHGVLLEHVYGILLDEKFLYRSVHAAFVNTKWYEAWLERTHLLDSSSTCSSQVCSRGRQATLVTATTQDMICQDTVSVRYLLRGFCSPSQVGRWPRLRPAACAVFPVARAAAANPWLESAFMTHVWLSLMSSLCVSFC